MRRISAIVLFAIALFLGSLTVASATTSPDTTDTSTGTSTDPATTSTTATDPATASTTASTTATAPATTCSSPSSGADPTGTGAGDKCAGNAAAQNPAPDSNGGTGAGTSGVSFSDHGGSLHLTSVADKYRQIDLGPQGDSIGDALAFSDKLFSDSGSHQIGTLDGVCTITRAEKDEKAIRQLCVVTMTMPKGQLTAQGVMRISPATAHDTFPVAITGGTSGYRGASGEAHVTFMSDTKTKIEVDLGH